MMIRRGRTRNRVPATQAAGRALQVPDDVDLSLSQLRQ